jgi:hypothetical protein
LGRCEAAFHSVADDVLTMRDENGTPTGKNCRLGPDDDERVIASRLKLEWWRSGAGTSDFNRALDCSRHGIA